MVTFLKQYFKLIFVIFFIQIIFLLWINFPTIINLPATTTINNLLVILLGGAFLFFIFKLHLRFDKKVKFYENKLYIDTLTNIGNRYAFLRDIQKTKIPIVIVMNIDNFKIINELYTVENGNKLLIAFKDFLENFIKNRTYTMYRLSGDEFAMIDHVDYFDMDKYEKDIYDLQDELKKCTFTVDNDALTINMSIGISFSQEKEPLETAHIALTHAKMNKLPFIAYSKKIDIRKAHHEVLIWKEKIHEAIESNRFKAVFHPIVDKNGNIVKYETLMRYEDDDGKLVSPFEFLEIAIKLKLYPQISLMVLKQGLEKSLETDKDISLNFTFTDIQILDLVEEIEEFVDKHREVAPRLVFEIVESESITDYKKISSFIKRFRKYGVKFAIDDFGSGYSNFEYILEIKPDYLKIDGSLVKNVVTDEKALALVGAIVGFSHKLGMSVIAEYIKNEKIFELLKDLDVDEYQGFYFYKPEPFLAT
jgi:diguanylate cyclase (GGDEF)-like protein